MRDEYNKRVETKGYGRAFHSLRDQQVEYVDELLSWINGQAEVTGAEEVAGYSEQWLEEDKLKMQKMRKMFEAKDAIQRELEDNEAVKKLWNKAFREEVKV